MPMLNRNKFFAAIARTCAHLTKRTAAQDAFASRAAVSIQQKGARGYLRFVLRAAFGFAAAFVFVFFAVFFRAMAM